jgi:hypothetical protein
MSSKSELAANVAQNLQDLEASVDDIESQLQPLLNVPLKDLSSQVSQLDNAKLYAALGYSVNTLFYSMCIVCHFHFML